MLFSVSFPNFPYLSCPSNHLSNCLCAKNGRKPRRKPFDKEEKKTKKKRTYFGPWRKPASLTIISIITIGQLRTYQNDTLIEENHATIVRNISMLNGHSNVNQHVLAAGRKRSVGCICWRCCVYAHRPARANNISK